MSDDRATGEQWERDQWVGQGQGGGEPAADAGAEEAKWQKEQWVGDDQAAEGEPFPTERDEGEHALSGHQVNPGGDSWGDVDGGKETSGTAD